MLNIGDLAPDFTAIADDGSEFTLSSLRGTKVVLYFYPKDNTPGCTQEACDFRDLHEKFLSHNIKIVGVSPDSTKSHGNFKSKFALPFPLVSDSDHKIVTAYGVWVEKKNYGRVYMGVTRTTFVIDETGYISEIFSNVRVKGHVDAVCSEIINGKI
ncbi:MAG: thioredoxin-dependent thiol peroxidase [SAR202 cluster bacterium]|nr:thioredoxin-dependent thiol peroxidase [SAR202 cluster bacterium]|tara:strand:+ start:107 stop:574 length:468 start_codon:yes stop_codon:yes gene_type:complete